MYSPLINWLKPMWHMVQHVEERRKWAHGNKLSARGQIDPNKVVLICNYGRGYLCNPKYIAEALNRLYPNEFDIVLLVHQIDADLPTYIRQVKYGSAKAMSELASAHFWIDNCRGAKYVPKRPDQFYLQTWHAYISPKRVEGDVQEHLEADYVRDAKLDGSITNLMTANNDLYARVYTHAFWYQGPIVRCGAPRNRPLILGDKVAASKARRVLGIPPDIRICLYAPTFRHDWSMNEYQFDFPAVTHALEKRFGGSFIFVYRLHPNLAMLERPKFFEGCIDATNYVDVQELLAASDVMISDYSSILEDFALTGRPGFVYAPDIESYSDDRGFYYSLQERPFPVATSDEEILSCIEHFDEDGYHKSLTRFFEFIGLKDDGHGDEVIAELLHHLAQPGNDLSNVISRMREQGRLSVQDRVIGEPQARAEEGARCIS